jgi:hypothetical protein
MDIRKMDKGTLFRFSRDTYISTSEYYYSSFHGIHVIKAHNIGTGEDVVFGEIAMYEAQPIQSQETTC